MIDFARDARPLADFKRNTAGYLSRLKKTRRPVVLTVKGKATVVVQDADSYQQLLKALDEADALGGISRGIEQANRGEGRPIREALRDLAAKHGIRLPK